VIEGLVGNIQNKMTQKRGRPSSADIEDLLNGRLHLIQDHDGKIKKVCAICSNREVKGGRRKDCAICSNTEVKGGRREPSFYCDMCPRKQDSTPISVLPYVIQLRSTISFIANRNILYLIKL
jgi:hypothetical protein